MNDATLIKHFLEYGKTHDLTKTELANLINVTRATVYRWESCQVKLQATHKRAIARILKSPPSIGADKIDRLTSEMFNEWKFLDRRNRLKILRYIEEIKTSEEKA